MTLQTAGSAGILINICDMKVRRNDAVQWLALLCICEVSVANLGQEIDYSKIYGGLISLRK
jgi:hypothetical protein